jgi:outer membrane protein assembly factor BamB
MKIERMGLDLFQTFGSLGLASSIFFVFGTMAAGAETPVSNRAPAALFEADKPDLYQATGPYVRTELRFTFDPPSSAVGDEPIQAFIHGTSTGVFTRAWAWWDGAKRVIPVDPAGLRKEGDLFRGELKWVTKATSRSVTNAIALEAQVNGTLVQGTFWRLLKFRHSERRLQGKVNGRLLADGELHEREALAPGRDYPCNRGPYGNGSAVDCGRKLVESFAKARLVWTSEDEVGSAWGGMGPFAGYGGVTVAKGRVYVNYHRPKPDHKFLVEERVLCTDAMTGRTLWRASWPSLPGCLKGGPHTTPCISGDTVIVQSSMSLVYALDAATGVLRWSDASCREAQQSLHRMRTIARGEPDPGTRSGWPDGMVWNNTPPMVADGVAMVSDALRSSWCDWGERSAGFDVATGRRLWDNPGFGFPLRWTHRGKEYFVATGTAIDPRSGRVLWSIDKSWAHNTAAVSENHLVTHYLAGTGSSGLSLRCYRIDPEKAVLVWELPLTVPGGRAHHCPVIHRGHVYVCARRLTKDSGTSGATTPTRDPEPSLTEPVPPAVDALDELLEGKATIDTEVEPPVADKSKIQPEVFCIELETGRIIATTSGGYLGQETLAADGMLMDNDATCLMSADPKAFRVLGVSGLPTSPAGWTASAIADGRLFIRMSGPMEGLACYDLREESK